MKILSSATKDIDLIKRRIKNQLDASNQIQVLNGCQIVIDSALSETWLVSPEGLKIRKICGHTSDYSGICLLPSGLGTDHYGKGKCKRHARSVLYNPHLNQIEGLPTKFSQLLQHVDTLEETTLLNVDHEIKFLYALQLMLSTMSADGENLSLDVLEQLQSLTMDIVKTKAIKNKIQREMRLDASSVKEFVEQIFKIVARRVPKNEAQNIFTDIMNDVIIPYRNQAKISGSNFDLKEKMLSVVAKHSPTVDINVQ